MFKVNNCKYKQAAFLAIQNPDYGLCGYLYARGRPTHYLEEKLGRKIQSPYQDMKLDTAESFKSHGLINR